MKKITAMLLVLAMVLAFAGCASNTPAPTTAPETTAAPETAPATEAATEPATEAVPVAMTHEEYIAAELDTEVTVETYVQAKQGWWTDDQGVSKATFYCQSEDGAYFLYDMPCSEEDYNAMTVGTKIRVTGYKAEWSGEVEIVDATYEILEGQFVAEALDVTELLSSEELIAHQNEFVAFTGLTVAASTDANGNEAAFLYNWDGSGHQGNDLYFNVTVNGATYNFCVESYLCGADTEVYKAVEALEIGDVINAEGFLYWYDGANPHITNVTVVE